MAKKKQRNERAETEKYAEFLKKAISSENFKQNDPVKYEKYKAKYVRVKLKLKLL
jgi:hypothetical protein